MAEIYERVTLERRQVPRTVCFSPNDLRDEWRWVDDATGEVGEWRTSLADAVMRRPHSW